MEHAPAPRSRGPTAADTRHDAQLPARQTETKQRRFRADWPTVASAIVLLLLAPISLACIVPFAFLIAAPLPGVWWHYSIAYYAVVPLALLPGMHWLQLWIVGSGTRDPSVNESAKLNLAWRNVLKQADLKRPSRLRLRVTDSADLNAEARGAHLVVVTTAALTILSASELEGVLAHELGHHRGFHSVAGLTWHWLQQPLFWTQRAALLLMAVGNWLGWLAANVMNVFGRSGWVVLVGLLLQVLLWATTWALVALSWVIYGITKGAALLMLWMKRRAEFVADRHAVQLRYGPHLLAAFDTLETDYGEPESTPGWTSLMWSTHPPMAKRRVKVIEEMERLRVEREHEAPERSR